MFRRSALVTSCLAIIIALSACSDDGGSSNGATSGSNGSEDASAAAAAAAAIAGDSDGDRPFGIDLEGLAKALGTATKADDVRIDGDTLELVFDEGSKDAPSAAINCSVAESMKGENDRIVLTYPDGVLDCAAEDG